MKENKILALKYRPQEFRDLIGQEIMSQTITNAIDLGKTPNAYLLTGIRGVGKTTTARLIAKALNCEKNSDEKIKCSSEKFCPTCEEIINSNLLCMLLCSKNLKNKNCSKKLNLIKKEKSTKR